MYDRPVGGSDLLPGIPAADDPIVERRPGSVFEPLPAVIPRVKMKLFLLYPYIKVTGRLSDLFYHCLSFSGKIQHFGEN